MILFIVGLGFVSVTALATGIYYLSFAARLNPIIRDRPDIVEIVRYDRKVTTIQMDSDIDTRERNNDDYVRYLKRKLADSLGHEMIDKGFVKFKELGEEFIQHNSMWPQFTRLIGRVDVVAPIENGDIYDKMFDDSEAIGSSGAHHREWGSSVALRKERYIRD